MAELGFSSGSAVPALHYLPDSPSWPFSPAVLFLYLLVASRLSTLYRQEARGSSIYLSPALSTAPGQKWMNERHSPKPQGRRQPHCSSQVDMIHNLHPHPSLLGGGEDMEGRTGGCVYHIQGDLRGRTGSCIYHIQGDLGGRTGGCVHHIQGDLGGRTGGCVHHIQVALSYSEFLTRSKSPELDHGSCAKHFTRGPVLLHPLC